MRLRLLEATPGARPCRQRRTSVPPAIALTRLHAGFTGSDGRVYRVKARAQQGLGAEMLCNRLACLLAVGPETRVMDIRRAVLPRDGRLNHLAGLRLATTEVESAFNDEELRDLGFAVDAKKIDSEFLGTSSRSPGPGCTRAIHRRYSG